MKRSKDESYYSILNLPEEMICQVSEHTLSSRRDSQSILDTVNIEPLIMQILAHLPLSAVGAMEQVCRHLRTVIIHARSRNVVLQDLREISPSQWVVLISLIFYDEGFGDVF